MPTNPTYYTIANAPFFPGVVALLNSLRLSGNDGELVILDRGLEDRQRARLEQHARIVEVPAEREGHPMMLKPFAHLFHPRGVVMIVDSDILVVRSLDWVAERAAAGGICLVPDPIVERWRPEWEDLLSLNEPVRRGTNMNTGFVTFSADRWPQLLGRWWELCGRVPAGQVFSDPSEPFWAGDQDVLNALVRSELPDGAVDELPVATEAFPEQLLRVRVLDRRSLRCELDGEPVSILHYSLGPKAWQPKAWLRLRDDAYVRLLPRLLFAEDVPLRLQPKEVGLLVRPGRGPAVLRGSLDAAHGGIRRAAHALPGPARRRLLAARDRFFRPLGG